MEAPHRSAGEELKGLLRKVSLFEGLADHQLTQLAELLHTRNVDAGETIFREGDVGEAFYIVSRGSVEIAKATPDGGEERLAIRRAGEGFGEMALVNDAPRSASAVALERGELLFLGTRQFRELMGPDSPAFRMLASLSRALRALDVRFAARERERMGAELREFESLVMAAMLPDVLPQVPGFRIQASPLGNPDDLTDAIWDFFPVEGGGTAVVVLAATGASAFSPSHTLSLARMALRGVGALRSDPGEILAVANRVLVDQAHPGAEVTCNAGLVVLAPGERESWAGAGHPGAWRVAPGGEKEALPVHGPPLGMLDGFAYATTQLELGSGGGVHLTAGSGAHGASVPAPSEDGASSGPVRVDITAG